MSTHGVANDEQALTIRHRLPTVETSDIERALTKGDVAKLTEEQRGRYYLAICESAGLNPLTKPFILMRNQNGESFFYATKECAEQLRKLYCVSVQTVSRERDDELYIVTVRATLPSGRYEESQGIVDIGSSKGQARANAMLRAESKAKRRVTLAICGLGFTGEEDSYGKPVPFNPHTGEIVESETSASLLASASEVTLQKHIGDLYGEHSSAPLQSLQDHITHILTAQGLSAEEIEAYWQRQSAKYGGTLTPAVLSMLKEHLEHAAAERARVPEIVVQDREPGEDDIPY